MYMRTVHLCPCRDEDDPRDLDGRGVHCRGEDDRLLRCALIADAALTTIGLKVTSFSSYGRIEAQWSLMPARMLPNTVSALQP